jgi:hypothetical protein
MSLKARVSRLEQRCGAPERPLIIFWGDERFEVDGWLYTYEEYVQKYPYRPEPVRVLWADDPIRQR